MNQTANQTARTGGRRTGEKNQDLNKKADMLGEEPDSALDRKI